MVNTEKYFILLESLHFANNCKIPKHGTSDSKSTTHADQQVCDKQRFQHNLKTLKKFVNLNFTQQVDKLCMDFALKEVADDIKALYANEITEFIIYMTDILHTLTEQLNFNSDAKEDLISAKHINLCINAIQELSIYALRQQLHTVFYNSNVFKEFQQETSTNYALLQLSLHFFMKLLEIKQFHIANSMELVVRDYMAAVFSLKLIAAENKYKLSLNQLNVLQNQLDFVWRDLSKMMYFHNILLLKATPQLPTLMQQMLHKALMQQLRMKDGYSTLVATLQSLKRPEESDQRVSETVAGIVAIAAHTAGFQQFMIKEVYAFCCRCLKNESMLEHGMGIGLYTLRRLYDLSPSNQELIKHLLNTTLKPLIMPEDVLSGLIVLEHADLCARINLLYQLFCMSIEAGLPSAILVDYLPLLLQLYDSLPDGVERQQINNLTTRCLDNRDPKEELPEIIERLYKEDYPQDWKILHPRLIIVPLETQSTQLLLKVAPADYKSEFSISLIIPAILMASSHHTLTYTVFMQLLQLMSKQLINHTADPKAIDFLSTEQELADFLNSKYPLKIEIILSLNTLIAYQPLKTQLAEHSKDFLKFLQAMLQQRLATGAKASSNEATDHILLILLTLLQELLSQCDLLESVRDVELALKKLRESTANELVKQRIVDIFALIKGDAKPDLAGNSTAFQTARSLIESKESHLQVYGIQMLLQLLHKNDPGTLSQGHLIIALALSTLKNKESYTFLNCVRLFAALVHVMEAEVLEVLADEYLSETSSMDYRLVVGEAILKVSRELGPFCYKYKATLLNCFMYGARSPIDEFRMSAFANLAQMCRILTYQVQNFFQELLHLIDMELTAGKYLPSKRAAVLVLSELLEGIDNLLDFEEMLLPIYKLLRVIEASESCDEKMRLHAANGLRSLNEKCKKFLLPDQKLQKDIQIFGIKDRSPSSSRPHILELN